MVSKQSQNHKYVDKLLSVYGVQSCGLCWKFHQRSVTEIKKMANTNTKNFYSHAPKTRNWMLNSCGEYLCQFNFIFYTCGTKLTTWRFYVMIN